MSKWHSRSVAAFSCVSGNIRGLGAVTAIAEGIFAIQQRPASWSRGDGIRPSFTRHQGVFAPPLLRVQP